ncbi:MAG: pilus assembly protein TadG-related protein [Marmoricola sp.]
MAIALALIICFIVVPLGGLAVDIGMQRVARGDMQTVADLAATDMARVLGTGTTPTAAMASASAARNVGVVGATPTMGVYLGYIAPGAPFASSQSRGCSGSPYDSYFQSPNGQTANAVLVTASTKVSFVIDAGSGGACRSAIAQPSASSACFGLGSYAAVVNSGDSSVLDPLNSIFGLKLSLLSYQNIAGAHLTLAQLAADSHFGTATQLLTGSIKVNDLVLAMINVLQAQNPSGNAAAISALNNVLTITAALPSITLSNLLHVSPTDTAAMATSFSVLDLLAGSVLLADGKHAVDIPNVWANVAGTGETSDAQLYVQQGASHACGAPNDPVYGAADNSQLNGYVAFDKMNSPSINIGVANMKTGIGTGRFSVAIAQAHGQLIAPPPVVCGNGTTANPSKFSVQVTTTLSSLQLQTQLPVSGSVTILGLGVVNLNLVVDVNVGTTRPSGSSIANVSVPPNDTTPVSTGSSIVLDPTTATVTIDPSSAATVLGAPISLGNSLLASTLTAIINGVQSTFVQKTVNPLASNLNTLVSGPISKLLGIDIGGADVYGLQTTCTRPRLVG